jgi:site-specific recombinase XerD
MVTRHFVLRASKLAQVESLGIHALRHTFCSHLAMKGAAAIQIQALAGHANLSTTQGYMHFSEGATKSAIRLLDRPAPDIQNEAVNGEI